MIILISAHTHFLWNETPVFWDNSDKIFLCGLRIFVRISWNRFFKILINEMAGPNRTNIKADIDKVNRITPKKLAIAGIIGILVTLILRWGLVSFLVKKVVLSVSLSLQYSCGFKFITSYVKK